VSRDVHKDLNPAFAVQWQRSHPGSTVKVDMSHGGSSKQARAVIDGLEADFVEMNSSLDIDAIAASGLLPATWAKQLPQASSPSWSTILLLVRQGNPKQIRDWNDLVRAEVSVLIANPKTSGNGRCSHLAAWEYARRQPGGNDGRAREFVARFLHNVPVFDSGGRAATTTFVQRGIGDALLTFENEVQRRGAGPAVSRRTTPTSTTLRPRRKSSRSTASGRRIPPRWHAMRRHSRSSTCSRWRKPSAAGKRRRRPTSAMAASSTRSWRRSASRPRPANASCPE
jgi:hypothetical protein